MCFSDEMGGLPYTDDEYSTFAKAEIVDTTKISRSDLANILNKKFAVGSEEWTNYHAKIQDAETEKELTNLHKVLTAYPDTTMQDTMQDTMDDTMDDTSQVTHETKQAVCTVLQTLIDLGIGNYDNEKHRANSIKKHLGTDKVNDCEDAVRLEEYRVYLQDKLDGGGK